MAWISVTGSPSAGISVKDRRDVQPNPSMAVAIGFWPRKWKNNQPSKSASWSAACTRAT